MNTSSGSNLPPDASPRLTTELATHAPLLDLLLRLQEPMRIESLAIQLEMTVPKVTCELELLREAGCQIDMHPQRGVKLAASGIATWADYLGWALGENNRRIIEVYAQTTSTQDAARRIATCCGKNADTAVAVADLQTAGRGRLGRRWIAPAGTAVTFTRVCLLKPASTSIDRLTLATTVAIAEAIEPLVGRGCVQIKWPNDLLIDRKKVAGILIETFQVPGEVNHMAALIGVGINVTLNPKDLPFDPPGHATSLCLCGATAERLHVLTSTLRSLDHTLKQKDPAPLLDRWRSRCPILSQRLQLRSDNQVISGQVIDLDPTDGLIVRTDTGAVVHLPAATATII